MKIQHFFSCCLILLAFSCQNTPNEPTEDQQFDYGCEVTLAQLLEVDTIVGIMQGISAWGEESALDSIGDLNQEIESKLTELLACAAVEKLELEGVFENLNYAQTADGRIRNFYWYANNGGTWQEMRRIYQYYPKPHVAKTSETDFFAGGTTFHKLKSDKSMYLGFGFDKTCSTCAVDYAILFSFEGDSLNMENVAAVESRMGDLLRFELDTATQTLHFAFVVDDMNQDWAEDFSKYKFGDLNFKMEDEGWEPEPDADVVVDSLVFDGKEFGKAQ